MSITAAETGHLVLTTLHTSDTISAINRIIDVFPPNQQQQIRTQLAEVLRGVVSQVLIPRKDNLGRAVASEILVCTLAVSNIIRQGNIEQIRSVLQTAAQEGMQTMDKSLENLYSAKVISKEHALMHAKDRNLFK
jgi:twitching motility protein PilT